MTKTDLETQGRIHGMFDVLRALDAGEWAAQISDDGNPAVCPVCSQFKPGCRHEATYRALGLVGHETTCPSPKARRVAFQEAVRLAESIPDGNLFLNLVTQLYLQEGVAVNGQVQ